MLACAAFAVAPQTRLDLRYVDPANPGGVPATDAALPAAVAQIAARSAGRTAVLRFQHNAWPAVTGILVQAERTGVPACVADPAWTFMMTSQFICTPAELADGHSFYLYAPGKIPRGARVVIRLSAGTVTDRG